MVIGIGDLLFTITPLKLPCVATGDRIAMNLSQKMHTVPHLFQICRIVELSVSHRIIKDKPGTADQMSVVVVVHRTVVFEVVIKTTTWINAPWMIKTHRCRDMLKERICRKEIHSRRMRGHSERVGR